MNSFLKLQHIKPYVSFVMVFVISCSSSRMSVPPEKSAQEYTLGGKMFTSLYQQRAAEYKALCLQGYNLAMLRIQNYVPVNNKPKAIITDLDETILDNSAYAVHQALIDKEFDLKSWQEWTAMGAADTLAGAANFLKNASRQGVVIFYITNRSQEEQEGTLKNLQKFGLPDADAAHLLLKTEGSSKELRRQMVLKDHQVILLMGDNLADFSSLWDKKTEDVRNKEVLNKPSIFGDKFIVFPNPNYGDWEGAFYKYNYNYSQAQKDSILRVELKAY